MTLSSLSPFSPKNTKFAIMVLVGVVLIGIGLAHDNPFPNVVRVPLVGVGVSLIVMAGIGAGNNHSW